MTESTLRESIGKAAHQLQTTSIRTILSLGALRFSRRKYGRSYSLTWAFKDGQDFWALGSAQSFSDRFDFAIGIEHREPDLVNLFLFEERCRVPFVNAIVMMVDVGEILVNQFSFFCESVINYQVGYLALHGQSAFVLPGCGLRDKSKELLFLLPLFFQLS